MDDAIEFNITIFLARFWGSLFMILGIAAVFAKFLGRVIAYTEEKTITISTGYITFLLGLATVSAHNLWVSDWRVAITILGWVTLVKGAMKVVFPEHVRNRAQLFRKAQGLWGLILFLLGGILFCLAV